MVHTTTQNTQLMIILNNRPDVMKDIISIDEVDDEQLEEYNKWLHWYNHLTQFEKDIYYLNKIGYNGSQIAKLYDCSKSTIYSKLTKLKR